jgi:hypothetical protein
VRTGLTIVLLLAAALGVAGSAGGADRGAGVAPRLLAALMEQPGGMLGGAQLTLPRSPKLLLHPLQAVPYLLQPALAPLGADTSCSQALPDHPPCARPNPRCSPLIARGP